MILPNLGMFLQEGNRARAYLQKLTRAGLLPGHVILLKGGGRSEFINRNSRGGEARFFDPGEPEEETICRAGLAYASISANSCDDPRVVDFLERRPETYVVFSGMGILKEVFRAGKKLIHVHPGRLPDYRGSTCPYYAALQEGRWHCSALVMSPEIDRGDIIAIREFPLPSAGVDATRVYDPHTRAEVLVDVARQLAETGGIATMPQDPSRGTDYYIIHPVLEYIAKKSFRGAGNV